MMNQLMNQIMSPYYTGRSNVTNMNKLFKDNRKLNENISNWNVSNVTDMRSMFNRAIEFNREENAIWY